MTADHTPTDQTPDPTDLDTLNHLWDGLATGHRTTRGSRLGRRLRPGTPGEETRAQTDTIRALSRADDTPDPDHQFLSDLRSTLMQTSHAAPRGIFDPILGPGPGAIPAQSRRPAHPGRPGVLRRFSGATMRVIEIAAVAALLLTMIGFAAGNDGLNDVRSLLTARQDDQPAPPAAMYLGNAAHTGEMLGPNPDGQIGLLWRTPGADHPTQPDSAPVVADGVLYLTTRYTDPETGRSTTALFALDLQTGNSIWEVPLPGFISDATNGSPVVSDGTVYVSVSLERWLGGTPATADVGATPETTSYMAGAVLALDAQTGQEIWTYDDLPRAGNHAPVIADGTLYVVTEDGALHALDALTGDPRWTAIPADDPGTGFAVAPSISDDTVYISNYLGQLHALDATTGTERWVSPIGPYLPTIAAVAADTVFVGTVSNAFYTEGGGIAVNLGTPEPAVAMPDGGQHLFAFDTATGAERWSFDPGGVLGGAPTLAGDTLLLTGVGDDSNEIVALAASDGAERWRTATDGRIITPAVWSGDTVYVGSFDSNLYALDLATGAVAWQVATGGGIASPAAVADGVVAFTSYDGTLYAVSALAPGATPTAGVPANDISGLPPCTTIPRPDPEQTADGAFVAPAGTPAAASVRPTDDPDYEGASNILFSDVPQGDPAPPEVVAAIEATVAEMAACDRPGAENRLASYYSDDYFRRTPRIMESFASDAYRYLGVPLTTNGAFDSVVVLADDRVTTVSRYTVGSSDGPTEYGYLVVWVEIDGRWLIDETVELANVLFRG